MKKIILLLHLLCVQYAWADFNQVSFWEVCPIGNPTAVKMSQPFDGVHSTGILLILYASAAAQQNPTDQTQRFYVLNNPYNCVPIAYQTLNSVQGFARKIQALPTSDQTGGTWAIYLVPFYVDVKTQQIVTDPSTINAQNKAEVWVAMFDSTRALYMTQKLTDLNPAPSNPSIAERVSYLDFEPKQAWLQVLNCGTWSANVQMGAGSDGFALSPFQGAIDNMMKVAPNPNIKNMANFNAVASVMGNPGYAALRTIAQTIELKKAGKSVTNSYNSQLPQNWFLSSQLLSKISDLFTSGTLPYRGLNSFSMSGWSQAARDYVNLHLAPALQALSSVVNIVADTNGKNVSVNFNAASFNGVIISTINNNTKSNFSIFQGSGQNFTKIGTLKPGANSIALYGAAHGQGDIVFVSDNSGMGTFRVSFKKGSDIMALTQSGDATGFSYYATGPSSGDEFLCVQMKKGTFPAGDFPQGTAEQEQQMISRTQCINLSQLTNPAYVTLSIEDSMVIQQGGKNITIDQTKIPMFYASIESVQLLEDAYLPYFEAPFYVQHAHLNAWFEFLNLVINSLGSNYTKLYSPTNVNTDITNAKTLFVLKKQGEDYGDLKTGITGLKDPKAYGLNYTSKNTGYVVGGLPGTEYLFTADIPSKQSLEAKLNPPKPATKPKDDKKPAKAPVKKTVQKSRSSLRSKN